MSRSTKGCHVCKMRKVKCDEGRPRCANCLRLRVPCSFDPFSPEDELPAVAIDPPDTPYASSDGGGHVRQVVRRGRPRKDWARLALQPVPSPAKSKAQEGFDTVGSPQTPGGVECSSSCGLGGVSETQSLVHFMLFTSASLVDSGKEDHPTARFWARNAPQIAFSHHFVLHLITALGGYHLAYSPDANHSPERARWHVFASRQLELGLAGLAASVTRIDGANAGALYVASMLVVYCAYAAGPSGPDDLLVCSLDTTAAYSRCVALVRGVRTIRETIDNGLLFSGLLAPLASIDETTSRPGPTLSREHPLWMDTTTQMQQLHDMLAQDRRPGSSVRKTAFDAVHRIYLATFGDSQGHFDGEPYDKMVFGWLWMLEDEYLAQVQAQEPHSLLILAYYVVLFHFPKTAWFTGAWAEHIICRVQELVVEEFKHWLNWPMKAILRTRA